MDKKEVALRIEKLKEKILNELYPKTTPDFDTKKYGVGSADIAFLKSTPKLKNFFEYLNEIVTEPFILGYIGRNIS